MYRSGTGHMDTPQNLLLRSPNRAEAQMAHQGSARRPNLGLNVRPPEEADMILGHHRHVLVQVVTAVAHDVPKDKFRSTSSGSGAVAACSLQRCKPVWGCNGRKQPPARRDSLQVRGVWVFGNLVKGFSAFWPFCCWLLE